MGKETAPETLPRWHAEQEQAASTRLLVHLTLKNVIMAVALGLFGTTFIMLSGQSAPMPKWSWRLRDDARDGQALIGAYATKQLYPPRPDSGEKYVAFLPHWGLHNQRLELENAIDIAQLTGRTLLLPHLVLGRNAVFPYSDSPDDAERYEDFIQQYQDGVLSVRNPLQSSIDPDADGAIVDESFLSTEQNGITHIHYSWLFNIDALRSRVKFVDRPVLSYKWIEENLGIAVRDFAYLDTTSGCFAWQLVMDDDPDSIEPGYKSRMNLSSLTTGALADSRLLYIGSMFGVERAKLSDPRLHLRKQEKYKGMTISNPYVLSRADDLIEYMGGQDAYHSLHLRTGDAWFQAQAHENVREILRLFLGRDDFHLTAAQIQNIVADFDRRVERNTTALYEGTGKCALPLRRDYPSLNRPLWVAQDQAEPRRHPVIGALLSLFPCATVITDAYPASLVASLPRLVNVEDGRILTPHLVAPMSAVVAAHAKVYVGTYQSTFSKYIENIHAVYHDQPVEPGRLSDLMHCD